MILNMPADLAKTMDFITAGSVVPFVTRENPSWFGERIPGTLTGPAVTASAPGSGYCYTKGTKVHPYTGSAIAGAVMAGFSLSRICKGILWPSRILNSR